MGLVKYKDTETDVLHTNLELFIHQTHENHPYFTTSLTRTIIRIISECIIAEKVRDHDLLKALEEMHRLKTPMYPVPEELNRTSLFYKSLVKLLRNENIEDFLSSHNFPEGYAAGKEEEISQMAKDIFDNIRDATERSLRGELTREETKAALKSRDPEQKKRALDQVNESWTKRINNSSLECGR